MSAGELPLVAGRAPETGPQTSLPACAPATAGAAAAAIKPRQSPVASCLRIPISDPLVVSTPLQWRSFRLNEGGSSEWEVQSEHGGVVRLAAALERVERGIDGRDRLLGTGDAAQRL